MSVTVTNDLFSPAKLGKNAVNIVFTSTPLLAIPGPVVDVADRVSDSGGETITFTYWDTDIDGITQDAVRDSRTGVAPSKIELKSYNEQAKAKTISIDGDRFALSDSSEDAMAHITAIVSKEFSRVIQADLISKVMNPVGGTNLKLDLATGPTVSRMSVDALLDARLQWGEKASELPPICLMHTAQYNDLAKTNDYKTLVSGGSGSIVHQNADWSNYVVGYVHGIPIVLCDSLPKTVEDDEITSHTALMVAPACFGVYISDEPQVEILSHAGSTVKTIDTHWRYATTMFRHAPRRAVKIITATEVPAGE